MMNSNQEQDTDKRKKKLVLIVDDVPKNLQLLATILKEEGKYDVAVASSGAKALKIVDNAHPELILLDVMMPEMDGFEVCRRLKASGSAKDIPIVFLTAKAGIKNIVKGFQAGGVDYVTKPFNGTELLARVKTHIQLKQSREKLNHSLQQLQSAHREILATNNKINTVIRQLTDSINYADLIQQAILPHKKDVRMVFKESFVLFKPRDIVGGDFFWVLESGSRLMIAAIDCTGHGVPGAFISILGYQLMREIIVIHKVWQPDSILNRLHRSINSVFSREKTDIRGGMDVALCSLDLQNQTLEFSGARSPLIYFHDNRLCHVKGNNFPVGGFTRKQDKVFAKQVIPYRDSTMCYIFSDGFPDQLGGDRGRRFTLKRFKELLGDIHRLPMEDQEKALEIALKDWMGSEYDQIDDIMVIGFRLNL
jgi:sigma-B regulation protein RsbU (phosphoserine phosphatase)